MRVDRFIGEWKTLQQFREDAERDAISKTLISTRGNVTQAAERLGISRDCIYDLMHKLQMIKKQPK